MAIDIPAKQEFPFADFAKLLEVPAPVAIRFGHRGSVVDGISQFSHSPTSFHEEVTAARVGPMRFTEAEMVEIASELYTLYGCDEDVGMLCDANAHLDIGDIITEHLSSVTDAVPTPTPRQGHSAGETLSLFDSRRPPFLCPVSPNWVSVQH
jgi:hypothetical protein